MGHFSQQDRIVVATMQGEREPGKEEQRERHLYKKRRQLKCFGRSLFRQLREKAGRRDVRKLAWGGCH